ncbi:30S ribosomal protein S17 [Candidatus Falkowbacteria bacterium]|nr:30S ribosomal protein S17 [Candidatus Falkowbacteria bacterium]
MEDKKSKILRKFQGKVVSTKMQNTAIVKVETTDIHPLYKKKIRISSRFAVDNPANKYKEGDLVEFVECRPLSKTKRWRIVKKFNK